MQKFVGILQQNGLDGLLLLDSPDSNIGRDLLIPSKYLNGAPFGMKVVAELLSPAVEGRQARARVIEVLGDPSRPDVAILAIIRRYGLPERFPEKVLTQAEAFPIDPDPADVAQEIASGRVDLRQVRTITIDGADAKDLDDAVSIDRLPGGRFRLGVHIADVSHYVTERNDLDIEARRRGNSVYLVDRVLPMLPPRLSNSLCSLNPGRDRLTLSTIMEFSADGTFEKGELCRSVICSQARTTYEEVRIALETGTVLEGRYPGFLEDLTTMRTLAEKLKDIRQSRGALDFEFPETKVELDTEGHPVAIARYPISFANELIESFMIAANEFVARELTGQHLPAVYRVHELPDPEKLARFTRLAKSLGIRLSIRGTPRPSDLAGALEQIRKEPAAQTLSHLLLRALAKARYAPENLGHFGLASEHYCHFTSPIRRYPDLFIHRVLKGMLIGSVNRRRWTAEAPLVSEQSSDTERAADQAERDTVAQKATEYMADRLGETYNGFISGFNSAGFFVQLENTVEGMVPFRDLDQYYIYDEERLLASTRDGRSSFHLGDPVTVQVARADVVRRQIDFQLLEAPRSTQKDRAPAVRSSGRQTGSAAGSSRQKGGGRPSGEKNKAARKRTAIQGQKTGRKRIKK